MDEDKIATLQLNFTAMNAVVLMAKGGIWYITGVHKCTL